MNVLVRRPFGRRSHDHQADKAGAGCFIYHNYYSPYKHYSPDSKTASHGRARPDRFPPLSHRWSHSVESHSVFSPHVSGFLSRKAAETVGKPTVLILLPRGRDTMPTVGGHISTGLDGSGNDLLNLLMRAIVVNALRRKEVMWQ